MTIVSGIQPSGKLHVGNALGAVRQWLALQGTPSPTSPSGLRGAGSFPSGRGGEPNRCFFFIADWHSLTEEYDAGEKAAQVRELAAELLALGIDPKRATLFRQSDLPEHLELAWYFSCVAPVGELERMTQYKEKLAHGESPTVGLFTYPVLMAADILAYSQPMHGEPFGTENKRTIRNRGQEKVSGSPFRMVPLGSPSVGVPVGDDQKQHLELANDIVRRFNNRYGETFPTIRGIHTLTPRIMSLKDPTKKMSKSLGGDHCLFLDDAPKEVERKIRAAVTDTNSEPTAASRQLQAPVASPGVQTLFTILEAYGDAETVAQFKEQHDASTIKYSELKPAVAEAFIAAHAEFRERKAALMAKPKEIDRILARGAKEAREVAAATLKVVRERVGVRG